MTLSEAIKWLKEMRKDIPLPKSAKSQRAKNEAIDMAVYALSNCSEFPNNWIPCSERLPEEAGTYLCTCADAGRLMVTMIKWQPRMKSWSLTGARTYWKVIAWKPLPEPYQPEEDESE